MKDYYPGPFKAELAVSLLSGQFKAVRFKSGKIVSVYESPEKVESTEDIDEAIGEACYETDYNGKYITFIYEGPRMAHVFLTTPPMSDSDLRIFLTRKADQEKTFSGKATFSYTRTSSPKGGHIVLLDLCEKEFIDDIVDVCHEHKLFAQKLILPSTILAQQVKDMNYDPESVVATVAEVGGRLTLLLGKGDGSLLLDRHFSHDWHDPDDQDRIGREIERSILFSKQQFGMVADVALFIGEFSEEFAEKMRAHISAPIVLGEHPTHEHYWITESRQIKRTNPANLIPKKIWREAAQHKMLITTYAMIIFLWLGAIVTTAVIEYAIFSGKAGWSVAPEEITRLTNERDKWKLAYSAVEEQQSVIDSIQKRNAPVPGWFSSYLGDVTPSGLNLTKVNIKTTGKIWDVEIGGESEMSPNPTANALKEFESELIEGPYHMNITKSWRTGWKDDLKKGSATRENVKYSFAISGNLQ